MKKIRLIIFVSLLFSVVSTVNAQYLENEPDFKQRIFWGGDVGLSFGSYTYVALNPVIGYRITNRISAGTGINYTFARDDYYRYEGSMYGGNVFASFTLVKNIGDAFPMYEGSGILLYGEYSVINISNYYDFPGTTIKWIGTPLAGIAFQTPVGSKSYMLLMFLYNLNETRLTPYPNPVIKACVQF